MAVSTKSEKSPSARRYINSTIPIGKRNLSNGSFSDVQSDIVMNVDGVKFSLHKFPLSSRSGRIRNLAEELNESDSMLEFSNFPGGPETFELAAMFCYGIKFEITVANIASLRCAAEYLEMTEDYGSGNLISRAEAFLQDVILVSAEMSAQVLYACEPILPLAENVKLVNRCIDAIASMLCKDQMVPTLKRIELNGPCRLHKQLNDLPSPHKVGLSCKATVEWWAEDLSILRIDLYQRVLAAMKSRGLRIESLGGSLMHFTQKALKSVNKNVDFNGSGGMLKPKSHGEVANSKPMEHKQRNLIESIVSMLPVERNLFPTSFLLGLLRTAIILDTTVACRLDLERRISVQLEHASPDDLLIPAMSPTAGSLFDVDVVQRILTAYLEQDESQDMGVYDTDDSRSLIYKRGLMKVAKLIDMYLAEIAPDTNLKISKFVSLAELLPEYSRVLDDGLYRAIDIFLKARPNMSDLERKKVCKLLDCQKLSQEACTHAAQNERLPVQLVVQVLYFEQLRMRGVMAGATDQLDQQSQSSGDGGMLYYGRVLPPHRASCDPNMSPQKGNSMIMRRDNRELKLEVARLRLLVNDLQKENASLKKELVLRLARPAATTTSSTGSGRFFSLFTRKLGRMSLFASPKPRAGSKSSDTKPTPLTPRLRRHSIS